MTTARDVIAKEIAMHISSAERALGVHRDAADDVIAALLSADESVKLELAGKLNPELTAAAEFARDVLRRLMKRENLATLTASANTAIHQINAALPAPPPEDK